MLERTALEAAAWTSNDRVCSRGLEAERCKIRLCLGRCHAPSFPSMLGMDLDRLGAESMVSRQSLSEVPRGTRTANDPSPGNDLKPRNVLLRAGRDPVVCDFGLSVSERRTPRFMAPEQRRGGRVDRRAEFYALGRLPEW